MIVPPDSRSTALAAARAALEKQAEDVVVMDLRSLSSVTDFFVLCTAGSGRQIEALKDHLEAALLELGWPVGHTEGSVGSPARSGPEDRAFHWILMDFGEVVVHLFDQRARTFYRLEDLWADAPRLSLPS